MKGRLVGLAIAGIAAGAMTAPAAGATVVPDASCTVLPGSNIVQAGDRKVAQTFTAIHTGALKTAQMRLKNPAASTPGDWLFEIAATSGGLPGPVLASTTVPNTLAAGATDMITGTFDKPAAVTAGGAYALLLSRPGSSSYEASNEGGDKCPGQQAYYQNVASGPFIEYPFVDFHFATTVELPPRLPSPSARRRSTRSTRAWRRSTRSARRRSASRPTGFRPPGPSDRPVTQGFTSPGEIGVLSIEAGPAAECSTPTGLPPTARSATRREVGTTGLTAGPVLALYRRYPTGSVESPLSLHRSALQPSGFRADPKEDTTQGDNDGR